MAAKPALSPVPAVSSAPIPKSTNPRVSPTKNPKVLIAAISPTPVPVEVEKFAFTTIEKGHPTLWTMNINGTERTRLTPIGTSSWHPLWSPNGKILAFLSTVNDGKINLYTVQKGSTQLVQLTFWDDMKESTEDKLDAPFTWSPKSDEIAYCYKNQIWVVNLDTLNQTTLVSSDPDYTITSLQWAPHRENKFIAYTVRKGENYYGIKIANPRLNDTLTLVESLKAVPGISWSSDASKLAYLSDNSSVYSTTIEDTTPRGMFVGVVPVLGPKIAYTPADGGSRLMVLAKKTQDEPSYHVAVLDPVKNDKETPALKFLTEAGIDDAVWSPDGSKIAYVTSGELWTMDAANGTNKTRVAITGIQSPDWSKK